MAATFREDLRKKFALLDGTGGKYEGFKAVGYRQVGLRVYRVFVMASFERGHVCP